MYKEESGDTENTRFLKVLILDEIEEDNEDNEKGYDPYNTATDVQSSIEK